MPRVYLPLRDRVKARLRKRALRTMPTLGLCADCAKRPARYRHHINYQWYPDLYIPLCRVCHPKWDKAQATRGQRAN